LYRRYVEGMLGLWDERRDVRAAPIDVPLAWKKRILTSLAIHFQVEGLDRIEEGALLERIRACGPPWDPALLLTTLRERTGLLVGPGVYTFVHKSVAEYLVAEAAVQGDHGLPGGGRLDRMTLWEHRHDDRWNTVLFLWAGLAPVREVESFVEECLRLGSRPEFALGIGILYDQHDRLQPTGLPRKALEAVCGVEEEFLRETLVCSYFTGGPGGLMEIRVPFFRLRGLVQWHGGVDTTSWRQRSTGGI